MKDILNSLIQQQTLSEEEAKKALISITLGNCNRSQTTAFISCFLMRPITVEELKGFREAMLDLCVKIDIQDYDTIDLCGTGGDGKDTFNISTLAAFVVAGAGQKVCKHGNKGVSSICGSSNVLQELGFKFKKEKDEILRDLEISGLTFLHAPLFHPAMKNVAPIRRELGIKTFFNMLGPLVNPARPRSQLIGVYNLQLARLYEYLLQSEDMNYCIVHSLDGYDEISLTSDFKCIENSGTKIYSPEIFDYAYLEPKELMGGKNTAESASIFLEILKGNGTEAQNRVVLANAAMGLSTAQNLSIKDALLMAEESLSGGKALDCLNKLLKSPKTQILI